MSDYITVLGALMPMRKKFLADGSVEPYPEAATFRHGRITVSSVHDLFSYWKKLEDVSDSCVVRGGVVNAKAGELIKRRQIGKGPEGAIFDKPCQWLCCDIDSGQSFDDLPQELQEATHVRRYSSSAKSVNDERGHYIFWLDKPITNAQARVWLKGKCDISLFSSNQVHYTANPEFEDGLVDPIDDRTLLLYGQYDIVPVPHIEMPVPIDYSDRILTESSKYKMVDRACEKICGAGAGDRHETINFWAYTLGGHGIDCFAELAYAASIAYGGDAARIKDAERVIRVALEQGNRKRFA